MNFQNIVTKKYYIINKKFFETIKNGIDFKTFSNRLENINNYVHIIYNLNNRNTYLLLKNLPHDFLNKYFNKQIKQCLL